MLVALHPRAIALATVLTAACSDPKVPSLGDPPGREDYYADILVADSVGAEEPEVCIDGALPACGDEVEPCGPREVLGPRDGETHTLGPLGKVDVGFRCAPVVERGGEGDLRIWSTLTAGAGPVAAVVYLSQDGLTYTEWNVLTAPNQILQLGMTNFSYARFIRVVGDRGITIDAFEVLNDDSVFELDAGSPPDGGAPDGAPAI